MYINGIDTFSQKNKDLSSFLKKLTSLVIGQFSGRVKKILTIIVLSFQSFTDSVIIVLAYKVYIYYVLRY